MRGFISIGFKPNLCKCFPDPPSYFFGGQSQVSGSESHVFHNGHPHNLIFRILKHHPHQLSDAVKIGRLLDTHPFHPDVSTGRGEKTVQVPHKGGLSTAIGSDDAQMNSSRNFHGNSIESRCFFTVIGVGEVFYLNHTTVPWILNLGLTRLTT